MAWLKLDDNFITNPKLLALSAEHKALYFWLCGYSAKELTDGVIAPHLLPIIGAMVGVADYQAGIEKLRQARLLEWDDEEQVYRIHDYLEYNPSREEVLALRATRAEAGAAGGRQSGKARREQAEAKHEANASAVASTMYEAKTNPTPVPTPVPMIHDDDDGAGAFLQKLLAFWKAKRFPTPANRDAWLALREKYGEAATLEGARKQAVAGIAMSRVGYAEKIALGEWRKAEADRALDELVSPDAADLWNEPAPNGNARASPPTRPKHPGMNAPLEEIAAYAQGLAEWERSYGQAATRR